MPAVLAMTVRVQPESALSRRGAVSAGARLRLGFNAPGVIAIIQPKTGDVVRKGQLLAALKDGDAIAAFRAAQAQQARALRDFRSADSLVATGSLPTRQRDDAQSVLLVANANSSVAAESLGQRRLVAPITGTVLERLAEPGEAVGPGIPVLVIEDTNCLVVRVGVNERELARIKPAQLAKLVLDGSGAEIPAVVTSISPAPGADGLYAVEVSPGPEAKASLRPGTLLTVRFADAVTTPSVRMPLDALVHKDDRTWVFTLDAPKEDVAHLREVRVDRADQKDVLVRTGLKDGDRIVREGAQFLQDGQAVRVVE